MNVKEVSPAPRQLPLAPPPVPDVLTLARPIALLAEGATEPPTEILLFAGGKVETTKGAFIVDGKACNSVQKAFADLGRLLPFDYEHASVRASVAPDPAEAGKAAGQFSIEVREGSIFATGIRWTPKAREKILAREFLYTSPAFIVDDEKRVREVFSCALTNDPAIKGREPLVASKGAPMDWCPMCFGRMCSAGSLCCQGCPVKVACASLYGGPVPPDPSGTVEMSQLQAAAREGGAAWEAKITALARGKETNVKTILAKLGLTENATEGEAVVAVARIQEQLKTLEVLTGKSNSIEALAVVHGWKAGADRLIEVSARLAELEKKAGERAMNEIMATAKREGRLTPAAEATGRTLFEAASRELGAEMAITSLNAYLAALPKFGGERKEPDEAHRTQEPAAIDVSRIVLTAEEKRQAKQAAGSVPKALADFEAAMLKRKQERALALATTQDAA